MSASFSRQDLDWLPTIVKQGDFSPTEWTLLQSAWDEQTDYDIKLIEEKIRKEKQARRLCIYKMIMYPFDMLLTKVLLGSAVVEDKRTVYKIYKAYYKKKINYIELQKRLANYYNNVKLSKVQ